MNHKLVFLGLLFVLFNCTNAFAAVKPADSSDSPSGAVVFRFDVPKSLAPEVWQFFSTLDMTHLAETLKVPSLTLTKSVVTKNDQYFDNKHLDFLDKGYSIYSQERILGLKKSGKPRIRENIVADVPTAEVAFVQIPVRHYRIVASPEEKHPLLGLVKRSEREAFMTLLGNVGIKNPFVLQKTIALRRESESIILLSADQQFAIVHLDKVHASKYGFEDVFHEVSLVNPSTSSLANDEAFASLSDYLQSELQARFPKVESESRNRYQKGVSLLSEKIPFFRSTLIAPLIFKGIQAVLIIACGMLVYALFFRKRFFFDLESNS